jgi:hypothetical protein
MSFLQWTFLFGSIAVAGPVLAHMLAKPRFRRLPFTMLQFLRSSQTESYSRRRLRDLLLLILRCVIIILIALLFARPVLYFKPKPKDARHIYFLGLDNSTSMTYTDGSSNYFQQMKDSAVEHIISAEADAVFNISSLASGNWTYGLSKQQALAEVKALKLTIGSADVDSFLSGIRNSGRTINEADEVSVLLVSDYTPQMLNQFLNVQEPAAVDNYKSEMILSPKPINNASIIRAKVVDAAADGFTINVSVANHGPIRQNRRLTAKIGTYEAASLEVTLSPDQVKICPVRLDSSSFSDMQLFIPVELSLSSGDNLGIDDKYYLAVRMPKKRSTNVLLAEAVEDDMFLLDMAMQTLSGRGSDRVIRIRRISAGDLRTSNLEWADVLVCSGINLSLDSMAGEISDFTEAGGRTVFFMTGEPAASAMNRLWQSKVLPALPRKIIKELTFPENSPSEKEYPGVDNAAAKAIANYRIDRIPVSGFWECLTQQDSVCLWQYQNGSGFIYFRELGNGTTFLVNTSANGSLGALTKSSVTIALCQYLLGEYNQIRDYSFTCNERVVLPITDIEPDSNREKSLWVRNCDGNKQRAILTDSSLLLFDPGSVGWVKTLTEPELSAGVNLPSGETDMSKPDEEQVPEALSRVFSTGKRENISSADILITKEQKPAWIILVWIIISLLLAESFVANRIRR